MVLEESSGETDQARCSAIEETGDPLRWVNEVTDYEAHSGGKFSLVPLYLGHLTLGSAPRLWAWVVKSWNHATGPVDCHSTERSIRLSLIHI